MKSVLTIFAVAVLLHVCAEETVALAGRKYEANWASLDARPTPQWWVDAKFGIFVHWGPYSVPAYAPTPRSKAPDLNIYDYYAEWYQAQLDRSNVLVRAHHKAVHGDAPYANFAAAFRAENFDASEWAELFRRAGARYVVLTSKHHDGYALWPSPESPYYNSVALGSGRDLCGEFAKAVRKEGLKCGFYYSLMEYANAGYPMKTREAVPTDEQRERVRQWSRNVNLPQMKELAETYKADVLWTDGEWYYSDKDQLSEEFLAWLFNESCVRDSVVVNDRWGAKTRGHHGGHYTTEYGEGADGVKGAVVHPWEECRGIGLSFGFNRMETSDDYMTSSRCIETLVDVVSRGGNLLLNVGPTADGRIPPIMMDRLLAIGKWLNVNGEAVYGTTRWSDADAGLRKQGVYFTKKGNRIYMILTKWPSCALSIKMDQPVLRVSMLGVDSPIQWTQDEGVLHVTSSSVPRLPCEDTWVFCISLSEDVHEP